MQKHTNNLFLLLAWGIYLVLMLVGRVTAQTFTTLHSFNGDDGSNPQGVLTVSSNTLYGTTFQGGLVGGIEMNDGGVFALGIDGSGFTELHIFLYDLGDGNYPEAGLVSSGTTLYGTTDNGGSGYGTVFSVNTDGSGYRVLYSFTPLSNNDNADGSFPGLLVLSGEKLYGTAEYGGTSGYGTVFAINTNGTGFTNLHNFSGGSDGYAPSAGLLLSGDVLYGTTEGFADFGANGGSLGNGTVFSIKTDGSIFTTLYAFTPTRSNFSGVYTNGDGVGPEGELVLSGSTLYGTAALGGPMGQGTVFALATNGSGFTNLHNFNGTSDGAYPSGSLVLLGDTLYGTTQYGGSSSSGTVFAVNPDGTGFTNLYNFTAPTGPSPFPTNSDGANPAGGLTLSGNALYGTAGGGGIGGNGTVFSISLPVVSASLTVTPLAQSVILTWPANATGYILQSTTNLGLSAVWTTNSPPPVVVNGQNTVTNPISGKQQFFRLSQ